MFYKMPFILIIAIVAVIVLDPLMPFALKQVLYSTSLVIKTIIVSALPFIIFSLLFKAVVTLASNATKILGLILTLMCCSNFVSTFLSHYVGILVYNFDIAIIVPQESSGMTALYSLTLPQVVTNSQAMIAGVVIGMISSKFWPSRSVAIATKIEHVVSILLAYLTYIIPIFVVGFIVKLQHDDVVTTIVKDYTSVFALIALAQFGYICAAYFLLNNMVVKDFVHNIKSMLPAAISGFSTMSSAASMPLTIIGAESNAQDKSIVRSVIPATANAHLVGDCFAIPILAYAVLKSFGMPEPSLLNYLIFTFYFVLAKFSVAAIPGGGIIVMLPVLERYLGFNAEMMSLITALYILFDPVITCANVLGNGAFAKMIDRCVVLLKRMALI